MEELFMGNYFLFFFMFFSNFQNFCKYILLNYTCWCNIHFHGITRPILGKIVKESEFVLSAFFPSSFPQRVLLRPRFINPLSFLTPSSAGAQYQKTLYLLLFKPTHLNVQNGFKSMITIIFQRSLPAGYLAPLKLQPKLKSLLNIISPH